LVAASEPARHAADVCLVLEGTYPYVAGGVSSWVHEIVRGLAELKFSLLHIGPHASAYREPRYPLPPNVVGLVEHYLHDQPLPNDSMTRQQLRADLERRIRAARRSRTRCSRTLAAIRSLHLDEAVSDRLIADFALGDLDVEHLLYGAEAFDVIVELYRALAPSAPFVDFFWHFRSMHVPLVRLLAAPLPSAAIYHSVSTGYAGVVAAVASQRTGRPMLLTEHGIYARERELELARATWISEPALDPRLPAGETSPLRRMWSWFFKRLSQVAYHQAQTIVTLSEVNRKKQLADGAAFARTALIPNGVDASTLAGQRRDDAAGETRRPLRVGFVGRVVPIKDVITFIKACDIALRAEPLSIEIIGPTEEDPEYVGRCRELVRVLGREHEIRFVGPRPAAEIYDGLDLVVLTSYSEGQPLVILEAHAAGIPAIATDVGACREMLEGMSGEDRALGPSGIVTRVASPEATAAAIVKLARDRALLRRMGEAGRARVHRFYTKAGMLEGYRTLYRRLAS
jgi:glycosyltransferase involved in cell wall biosynthesis